MTNSICGIDCTKCELSSTCNGCAQTNGHPFGGECIVALCYQNGAPALCELKEKLLAAFNALHIKDMDKVTDLNALKGSFINMEYALPSGHTVKFWEDNKIYLGNQLCKKNSDKCYGLAADGQYLMVCEYGANGFDAHIVVFKRWN